VLVDVQNWRLISKPICATRTPARAAAEATAPAAALATIAPTALPKAALPSAPLAAPAPPAPLAPLCNQRVIIAGLVARPELNGRAAFARSFDADRYVVELDGAVEQTIRVREQNLRLAESYGSVEEQD
jgi:hypothetical protein